MYQCDSSAVGDVDCFVKEAEKEEKDKEKIALAFPGKYAIDSLSSIVAAVNRRSARRTTPSSASIEDKTSVLFCWF